MTEARRIFFSSVCFHPISYISFIELKGQYAYPDTRTSVDDKIIGEKRNFQDYPLHKNQIWHSAFKEDT